VPDIAEHIATWESAGLIDAETAGRLRASLPAERATEAAPPPAHNGTAFGDVFGPSVHVAEAFTYLGVGFLASAWTAFVASAGADTDDGRGIWILGTAVSALVFALIAMFLRRGDDRWRRGAGVAALVSTLYTASASWFVADQVVQNDTIVPVVASLASLAAAVAFRRALPSSTTQFAVLLAGTALAAALIRLLGEAIFGPSDLSYTGEPTAESSAIVKVLLEALWWIGVAVVFGVIGLRESRAVDDPAAQRRAGLSRLWASLVLVIGVAQAVTRSGPRADLEYGRLIEPFVADLILIVISVVLIERAFRRGSGAFLVGGALALIAALTDFNASYLTDTVQAALLVEGVILLAIGFGANRLRAELDRRRRLLSPDVGTSPGT